MSFWSKYVNSDRPFQIKLPVFARPEVSSLNFYCGGMTSEAYSDPCQTFTMKRFAKIVDSFQLLHIFTKSAIFDVWQSSKYTLLICSSELRLTLGSFCSTIIIIAVQCSEHIKKGLRLKVEVAEASIQSCSGKWVFCNFRQNPLTIDD